MAAFLLDGRYKIDKIGNPGSVHQGASSEPSDDAGHPWSLFMVDWPLSAQDADFRHASHGDRDEKAGAVLADTVPALCQEPGPAYAYEYLSRDCQLFPKATQMGMPLTATIAGVHVEWPK